MGQLPGKDGVGGAGIQEDDIVLFDPLQRFSGCLFLKGDVDDFSSFKRIELFFLAQRLDAAPHLLEEAVAVHGFQVAPGGIHGDAQPFGQVFQPEEGRFVQQLEDERPSFFLHHS